MSEIVLTILCAACAGYAYLRMSRLVALMNVEGWHPGPRLVGRRSRKAIRAMGYFLLSVAAFLIIHGAPSGASTPGLMGAVMVFAPGFFSANPRPRRHDHDRPIGPELPRGQYAEPIGPQLPYPDLRSRESVEKWLES